MHHLYDAAPAAATTATGRPMCPYCHGTVKRVPRRWVDRLLSFFVPMRRYRCHAMACNWEGALRDAYFRLSRSQNTKRYQTRINPL